MNASDELRHLAIRTAREAGASALTVSAAHPDESARERMRSAFERDDFRTWGYDDEYARAATDPAALLAGARSVLCVAIAYAHPQTAGRVPLAGRVSNYAWSADYHVRVRCVLDRIARALDDAAGAAVTRVVCDTAPLAERAFAARSGLGWIGKHTNLIAPKLGSFVFLGEIVTTLELRPDAPLKKSCGSCKRCVDVCPTHALRGDYTIDASRCISDLTQRTDAIPRDMRTSIGDWVWGCDLCQLACPPTQRAAPVADAAFAPAEDARARPSLRALLALRSGEFKRTYRGTAMGWRGAAVLRRNAAIALGNAMDRAAVPWLEASLTGDPHPLVRGHAAWALGRIGSPRALAALRSARAVDADDSVREEIDAALATWSSLAVSSRIS